MNIDQLKSEYNEDKNDEPIERITLGSNKKIWWVCSSCSGEWEASMKSRVHGSGCPYCAGKRVVPGKNDLAALRPDLAVEWDYKQNKSRMPSDVALYSNLKAYWICAEGHSWQALISNRARFGSGCPYCKQNRQKVIRTYVDKSFLDEWDYDANGEIPNNFNMTSRGKVYWKCHNGHKWAASPYQRSRGSNCPFCSGKTVVQGTNDLATLKPELAAEWDTEKNDCGPSEVAVYSHKRIWWRCRNGHSWEASVYNRTRGSGCPLCKKSV